jgi:hypothetical protein
MHSQTLHICAHTRQRRLYRANSVDSQQALQLACLMCCQSDWYFERGPSCQLTSLNTPLHRY